MQTASYTGLYITNLHGKEAAHMDEHTTPVPEPVLTVPAGDVDDLIFRNDPDWYTSER